LFIIQYKNKGLHRVKHNDSSVGDNTLSEFTSEVKILIRSQNFPDQMEIIPAVSIYSISNHFLTGVRVSNEALFLIFLKQQKKYYTINIHLICNIFVWVLKTHLNPYLVIVFHVAWVRDQI